MNYEMARMLGSRRWFIRRDEFAKLVTAAQASTPEAIQAAIVAYGQSREPMPTIVGDVAVIEACGPIVYRRSWFSMLFGCVAIEDLQRQLRSALADTQVKTIVFRWDSPGGLVNMVPEFADEVFAARGQKPMISVADLMTCSAAYWIASQTDIIYATVTSDIGSVGAYMEHEDISGMLEQAGIKVTLIAHGENKVAGNMYEPLSDDVRAKFQEYVDFMGDKFDAAVARGRGVTKKVVLDTFGQGDCFPGEQAISIGLADKLGTFSKVVGKLTKGRAAAMAAGSTDGPIMLSADADAIEQVDTAKPKAEAFGCSCSISCPCQDGNTEWCPEGCETCDPDCSCQQRYGDAKAKTTAQPIDDAAEIEADQDYAAAAVAIAERL